MNIEHLPEKAREAMDASNMLKQMLACGELHCIGATTLDEYRKHIEKDAALERRFQPIMVDQPSVEDTISILRVLKQRYEVHHGVRITDSALVAAAVLSNRYITDHFLPDKAIDLVDEAASHLRVELDSTPSEIDALDRASGSCRWNSRPSTSMARCVNHWRKTMCAGRCAICSIVARRASLPSCTTVSTIRPMSSLSRNMQALHICFAKLCFDSELRDRTTTACNAMGSLPFWGGISQWSIPISNISTWVANCNGFGGATDHDGEDATMFAGSPWGKGENSEVTEAESPLLTLFQARLVSDTCGFGKYRGGAGVGVAWTVHNMPVLFFGDVATMSYMPNGVGLFGGFAGGPGFGLEIKGCNVQELMAQGAEMPSSLLELIEKKSIPGEYHFTPSLRDARPIMQGEVFAAFSRGGSGYGDPLERDPESVVNDLQSGIISPWVSEHIYQVVYDPRSFLVEADATAEKHRQFLQDRIQTTFLQRQRVPTAGRQHSVA